LSRLGYAGNLPSFRFITAAPPDRPFSPSSQPSEFHLNLITAIIYTCYQPSIPAEFH